MNTQIRFNNICKRMEALKTKSRAYGGGIITYDTLPDGSKLYHIDQGNGEEAVKQTEFDAYWELHKDSLTDGVGIIIFRPTKNRE